MTIQAASVLRNNQRRIGFMAMGDGEMQRAERELLRKLQFVARRRASLLGITGTDYLIGILEGRFPRITPDELRTAKVMTKRPPRPSQN